MTDNNTLILIDGSSYLFRAYYAMPPLTNASGMPTGAIYGVVNMLKRMVKEHTTDRVVVVFDPKGKTARHAVYPEYKANRATMPEDLAVQIPALHDVIRALGFPLVIEPGEEADDVIGTLTRRAVAAGLKVLISTGDKDMAQLVNGKVALMNTMTDSYYDASGVETKYGVPPERIIDYLALMGDTSDNIPGVNKVGPKTAVKWLTTYGDLAGVIAAADQIKGKVGDYLREAIASESLALSQQLVTINTDLPLSCQVTELSLRAADTDALAKWYRELEFKSWLAELQSLAAATASVPVESEPTVLATSAPAPAYSAVTTLGQWKTWLARLREASVFALDTETTSLNVMEAELVGISLATAPGEAAYVPLAHDIDVVPEQLSRAQVLADLQSILNDPAKTCVGQNLKYDLQILRHCGVTIANALWDTMLASYVLNQSTSRHGMDTLARQHLGLETQSFVDVAGKGAKQKTFNQIALGPATAYAAEDADVTLQLYHHFEPLLRAGWAKTIFYDIEMPLMPVLADLEYTGVNIDKAMLAEQSAELALRMQQQEAEVYTIAGETFNIASPKQLQAILYEKLQLPVIKKTPKGQPSTAEDVLVKLSANYPLPKLILAYRSDAKLKSTYTDRLPEQISTRTQRVHTHYNQTVTSTGRLSSNEPNLQNIPIRHAEGRKIRQAFIAAPGRRILAADYSQIELRLMAHLSQEPNLIRAFTEGEDVHAATAAEVNGVAVADVTDQQRRAAKAINFGLMYGMSAFGLAQQLGIERGEAQTYIDTYFARYPQVLTYLEQTRTLAAEQGYVETILGRRLLLPNIQAKNALLRKAAERAAINAPLQGSAAEMIKRAMIDLAPWQASTDGAVSMLMQVHDELVFSIEEAALSEATKVIQEKMENAVALSVPVVVECGVGANWDQAH